MKPRASLFGTVAGCALASVLLAACGVMDPLQTTGNPPPLNVKPGLLLLEIPPDVVERLAQPAVQEVVAAEAEAAGEVPTGLVRHMLEHRVVTGMAAKEVVGAFLSHPTRVLDSGPAGAHTWFWEPGRYWVRFDDRGQVISAGRY